MAVDYNDKRFQNVKSEETKALQNANNTYNNLINESNGLYQNLSNAAEEYGKTQSEIQQANTDFAIEQINQQKEWQKQDYTKEQKGAYADWQKQSNQYGVNAEQMAASGLNRTGYSESSQVNMYNTYQNRVAQARETYNRAVVEYDNAIKDAQLQNNAKLAEISYQALQTKLEYALNNFQTRSQLQQQQLAMQNEISNMYYNRWKDVLSQINTENALAEEKRQFDKQYALSKKAYSSSGRGSYSINPSGGGTKNGTIQQNNTSSKNTYGNSTATQQKSDYYAKNGYQPNYINNERLKSSGKKVYDVFSGEKTTKVTGLGSKGITPTAFGNQTIWTAGGRYYVWDGSSKSYVDVTDKYKTSVKEKVNFTWGE